MKHRPIQARPTRVALTSAVTAVAAMVFVAGCTRTAVPRQRASDVPEARQTLEQIQPPVELEPPATQPATPAPPAALQLYAQARDALLQNRRPQAIDKLTAAIEIDPYSAVMFRDLGYAWLGTDNDRALSAYRQALRIDPTELDSRIQVARILLNKQDLDGALRELRLARLSPAYDPGTADSAVVDLLLGNVLAQSGYFTAALQCFERVLAAIELQSMELVSRPELSELFKRPSVLRLRIADLLVEAGAYDRAIELYDRLREDEPNAAGELQLRVARVLASKGDTAGAARQVLLLAERYDANRQTMQAYIDLFEERGGDKAALKQLDADYGSLFSENPTDREVIRARLLSRLRRHEAAVKALDQPGRQATLSYVRELVRAYRATNRAGELPLKLLTLMTEQPERWQQIARGWEMLTHTAQPSPLSVSALQKLDVPDNLQPARQFVLAQLASERGQPALARRSLLDASKRDRSLVQKWLADRALDQPPTVDASNPEDLADFVREFSDDPGCLTQGLLPVLRQGQKQAVYDALQAELQARPGNLPVMVQLASMFLADDQRDEVVRLIERTAPHLSSASELYQLSALLTQIGDAAGAEAMLRRAYAADPHHPPTCNDLGYLLADSDRELEFAEQLLWRAVGAEPENPAYVDSLGWLLYKRSKFAEAAQYLEQALTASVVGDPVVLDHAADAAYRLGDAAKARQHWQQAIATIKERGTNDPQLRLRIERKLRQLNANEKVDVAAAAGE